MLKKLTIWCCVFFFILASCAPKEFTPFVPEDITFEPTPYYDVDLSKLGDIQKIKPIYMDEDFNEVPIEQAKYAVLVPEEYKKVAINKKVLLTQRKVVFEQAKLININVDIINSLKEYAQLERQKAKMYRELWVNSENSYRQEQHQRRMDDLQNKAVWFVVLIGTVTVIALTL